MGMLPPTEQKVQTETEEETQQQVRNLEV
jgi:hypothetical protein